MNFHNNLQGELTRIAQRLRERGYRVTPQRMAIVETLLISHSHPTAEEIHQQVGQRFPMVSLATVYKTLHVLRELGIVREVQVDGRAHFDGNAAPHAHLVCTRCHRIIDLPADTEIHLPMEAVTAQGFRVLGYNLEVYGLCSRCQAEEPSTGQR